MKMEAQAGEISNILQIVFALVGMAVHLMICLHYLLSQGKNGDTDTPSDEQQNIPRWKIVLGRCVLVQPWALSLILHLLFVSVGVTTTADSSITKLYERRRIVSTSNQVENEVMLSTWEITGMICGGTGAAIYWMSRLTDIYRKHNGSILELSALAIMTAVDVCYLIAVYLQGVSLKIALHALPWTLTRTGLAGINIGIIFQLIFLRCKYTKDDCVEEDLESLLSNDSNVLWQSSWQNQHKILGKDESVLPRDEEEGATANMADGGDCPCTSEEQVRNGPSGKIVSYGSSETSVTLTNDPELEWDFEWEARTRSLHTSAATSERRGSFTVKLLQLETETRHERIKQWFERSTPEEENVSLFDYLQAAEADFKCTDVRESSVVK